MRKIFICGGCDSPRASPIGFATHVKKCGGIPVPVEYIQYLVSKLGYARVRASRVKGPMC